MLAADAHWPVHTIPQGRCIWFASVRTAFGPFTEASVSCFASRSAASCDFRGGPRMVKIRVRPAWLTPPWGTWISACQMGSPLVKAGRSSTSATATSPVPSAVVALWGILMLISTDFDRDLALCTSLCPADRDLFEGERFAATGAGERRRDGERRREGERRRDGERFLDVGECGFLAGCRLLERERFLGDARFLDSAGLRDGDFFLDTERLLDNARLLEGERLADADLLLDGSFAFSRGRNPTERERLLEREDRLVPAAA